MRGDQLGFGAATPFDPTPSDPNSNSLTTRAAGDPGVGSGATSTNWRREADRDERGSSQRTEVRALRVGSEVEETYLVASKELRTTRSGKPYLRLRVGDRSGVVDCMVWDDAERMGRGFQVGDLVTVRARVSEYEGRVQLEARSVEPAQGETRDPRDFLPSTYRDVDELRGFLEFQLESVCDSDYRALLHLVFDDPEFLAAFCTAPAAKQYHHAYLGGLLEHTVAVAELCEHVCQQYPRINRDLLMTAALLHDVGKVTELSFDRVIGYTDAGRLLGHVVLGVAMVTERARSLTNLPEEKLQILLHAIVSHHGELEWGSPKRPKTLEALILHHVDNLDAKVKGFLEIVEGSGKTEWTDLKNLFRRPLHVPRATHQEPEFLPPQEGDF